MTEDWGPTHFHDTYRDDVMALVKKKIKSNQTKTITMPDDAGTLQPTAKVIDLMALLKRSLETKNVDGASNSPKARPKSGSVTRVKSATPAVKKAAPPRRRRA